mgnify:CR=1 FL=1
MTGEETTHDAARDRETCSECGTELEEAPGIAVYCPNDECPENPGYKQEERLQEHRDAFTDDEQEQFEEALEDTSMRAMLIQQTQELKKIRACMELLVETTLPPAPGNHEREPGDGENNASETASTRYECTQCGTVVDEPDRETHAVQEHNAPKAITNTLFEPVE